MNNNITTLEKVGYNFRCKILGFLPCCKLNKDRLCDIGIASDTEITPLYGSIFEGIKTYLVKGSMIALRNIDAKFIVVSVSE